MDPILECQILIIGENVGLINIRTVVKVCLLRTSYIYYIFVICMSYDLQYFLTRPYLFHGINIRYGDWKYLIF